MLPSFDVVFTSTLKNLHCALRDLRGVGARNKVKGLRDVTVKETVLFFMSIQILSLALIGCLASAGRVINKRNLVKINTLKRK